MAHTPKPVRKAIKARKAHYRKELKEEPSFKNRFLKGKKGAQSIAKRSIKSHAESGKISRKGKVHPKARKNASMQEKDFSHYGKY